MVNTKISEVSEGGVALGENKFARGMILGEDLPAGTVVMKTAAGTIAKCNSQSKMLGVLKEHEEFDLDTDITSAKKVTVVTEGYVAAFMAHPGATKYAGTTFVPGQYGGDPGKFKTSTTTGSAKLLRDVVATDEVGVFKLMG